MLSSLLSFCLLSLVLSLTSLCGISYRVVPITVEQQHSKIEMANYPTGDVGEKWKWEEAKNAIGIGLPIMRGSSPGVGSRSSGVHGGTCHYILLASFCCAIMVNQILSLDTRQQCHVTDICYLLFLLFFLQPFLAPAFLRSLNNNSSSSNNLSPNNTPTPPTRKTLRSCRPHTSLFLDPRLSGYFAEPHLFSPLQHGEDKAPGSQSLPADCSKRQRKNIWEEKSDHPILRRRRYQSIRGCDVVEQLLC